jgi:hypothetical protein
MKQNRRPRHISHSYSQLIFDKGAQNTWWRKNSIFNKCCENWISTCRRLNCLSPCTSINSKWVTDLTIRPETFKQLQEVVGNTVEHTDIGNDFLNRIQMAQQLRERVNKWDCIKLKSFCTAKEIVTRRKRQPREWDKIFARYSSDKGLRSRIYRSL